MTALVITVAPNTTGWIGSWSPGIGDPTPMGWLTVVAYLAAAWQCFQLARGTTTPIPYLERRVWWLLATGLLVLGINKQLDLQSAFTEAGRLLARAQGWYAYRGEVQIVFIVALALIAVVGAVALFGLTRRTPRATKVAVLGAVMLVTFVMVRAMSFHHVDRFIGLGIGGLKINWVLELGGIAIILVAARWRAAGATRGLRRPSASQ
jgi:hypothetical protein